MSDNSQINVFDRSLLRLRRERAAQNFAAHSALFGEIAAQISERLADIKEAFSTVLDLGAHDGALSRAMAKQGAAVTVTADLSEKMLGEAPRPAVVVDEEFLPFASGRFDLIVSNLSLHWVNDLPGALLQIKEALRPGGLLLATMLGGSTLHELRTALLEAELKLTNGTSPRLSPILELPDASALLQRAGFVLPVTDREIITLTYPDLFALLRDLRGMGETAVHFHRSRRPTRRQVFFEAEHIYQKRFALADQTLPATFEILFLHGRRPLT